MSEFGIAPEDIDLSRRLRSFLAPHIHLSAAHKDALAEAAMRVEALSAESEKLRRQRDDAYGHADRLDDALSDAEKVITPFIDRIDDFESSLAQRRLTDDGATTISLGALRRARHWYRKHIAPSPLPTGSEDKDVG